MIAPIVMHRIEDTYAPRLAPDHHKETTLRRVRREFEIIGLMEDGKVFSWKALMKSTGLSKSTLHGIVSGLIDSGVVERFGRGNDSRYRLTRRSPI